MELSDVYRGKAGLWHRFSFEPSDCSFVLDSRVAVEELINKVRHRDRPEKHFDPFVTPGQGAWGHGGVVVPEPPPGGWLGRWRVKLPNRAIKSPAGWRKLFDVSASLSLIALVLQYVLEDVHEGEPRQMLLIDGLGCDPEAPYYGAPIGLQVLPACQAWLATQDVRVLASEMSQSMALADSRMYGRKVRPGAGFMDVGAAFDSERFLQLRAGGNCACLGFDRTSSLDVKDALAGNGYELKPHNTDSPVHQLTLLAGIATLWARTPA